VLELLDGRAHAGVDRDRPPLIHIDLHHRLAGGDEVLPGGGVVRLELPDHAAGAHPGDADEHVQQVVEPCRRVVLDVLRAHHQFGIVRLVLQQAEVA
jgi:hypothetical protein